jgi:hypothetical protein
MLGKGSTPEEGKDGRTDKTEVGIGKQARMRGNDAADEVDARADGLGRTGRFDGFEWCRLHISVFTGGVETA